MRTASTFLTLCLAALAANALELREPSDPAAPKVVQYDLHRNQIHNPIQRDRARMRKRADGTVNVALLNEVALYFLNVSIGTPGQNIRLHVDTGSSDLWVNTPGSQLCESRGDPCDASGSGTYTANSSSTYKYINSEFNISYVDGSGSVGDYVSDNVELGGVTLKNQRFGIGYSSSSAEGILGIGYAIHEVSVVLNGEDPYPNVPQSLVDAGAISHNAYSLYLNDVDSATGAILFGGVNTGQYTGKLETVPVIPVEGYYQDFVIAMTGVGHNGQQGSIASNVKVPALLDSGSSLMYVPDEIASSIYSALQVTYDSSQGVAIVPCSAANKQDTIEFTFSGPTISVPMSELVTVAGADESGNPICVIGVLPADGTTPVLGDTFLRSAYVVYDLGRNQISLAQSNLNSTTNNIMEITNTTGVPDATIVNNAVTSVAAAGTGSRNGGLPHVTSGSFAMPTAAPDFNMAAFVGMAGAGLLYAL